MGLRPPSFFSTAWSQAPHWYRATSSGTRPAAMRLTTRVRATPALTALLAGAPLMAILRCSGLNPQGQEPSLS